MLDPSVGIPAFDPIAWKAARQRAAPAIGQLILNWAAIDTGMVDTIYKCRCVTLSVSDFLSEPMSQTFKKRLNEWIRSALPMAGRVDEGERIRSELLRLQGVRDDIAHNIEMIWLSQDGNFVIRTSRGASRPIPVRLEGDGRMIGMEDPNEPKTRRYVRVYEERDIWKAIDDTHAVFISMQAVRPAVFKAMKS